MEESELQLTIKVADAGVFLSQCKKRVEEERKRFQRNFTPEELANLRKEAGANRERISKLRAEREAERIKWRKQSERDGRPFSVKDIGDFYSMCRKADGGRWSVQWGKQPGEKCGWVVIAFDGSETICCFKLNMRVMGCCKFVQRPVPRKGAGILRVFG